MSHTAGPWKAFISNGVIAVMAASGKEIIHWSGFDSSEYSSKTDEANAVLIAAAPELLDALKKNQEWLLYNGPGWMDGITHPLFVEANNRAFEAIAKAEGRA